MKRIKEIRIQNFKAFQDEQVFDFGSKGKNVLVYGNNGSGKSSLFWALYTLLQSSIKEEAGVQKYFLDYAEGNTNTHQSLKNVFMDAGIDAHIKMTSIDTETQHEEVFTISQNVINTNVALIQELNLASDFINYKLLHNFYRGPHKVEVNIWPVFERDIFPFLAEGAQNWLDDILKAPTLDIPKGPGGRATSGRPKEAFITQLDALNTKVETLLAGIQSTANTFLREEFNGGEDKIKISLNFNKKFNWNLVKQRIWEDDHQHIRHEGLKVSLSVEVKEDGDAGQWKPITRIQSFLNEAQLTRIAIAIRIGALRTRPQNAQFKILVLDDMLISLDLSNRMDVVRLILNKEEKESLKFFDDFQKIILTHDKGFFNLIRRHTEEEDWVYYDFQKDEKTTSAPKVRESKSSLQKAIERFEEEEFDACGNELRKEAEAILTDFLDPEMKKLKNEFESLGTKLEKAFNVLSSKRLQKFKQVFLFEMDIEKLKKIKSDIDADAGLTDEEKVRLKKLQVDVFDFLIKFNEERDRKEKLIQQTQEFLDRVMNPASHQSENPLYRAELKEAIEGIKELKNYLQ